MELEAAISGISKYRKLLHEKDMWSDPEPLSEAMLKLATYNSYLADHIAPLHKQATEHAVSAYKAARDMEATATDSDRLSKAESLEDRQAFENVKYIYQATGNLIGVIQSRLNVIRDKRREEGI